MAYYLKKRFKSQIIDELEDRNISEISEEEIEQVLEDAVEVSDPNSHPTKFFVGDSINDTRRRKPITVKANTKNVSKTLASLVAGSAIPIPEVKATVLLLIIASVCKSGTEWVKPNSVLVYKTGWQLSKEGKIPVKKDRLISEVVHESRNINEIEDMTRKNADTAIQTLEEEKAISTEKIDGEIVVWFNEEFKNKHSG